MVSVTLLFIAPIGSRIGSLLGLARLDRQWPIVCKDFSPPEFSHALELIVEALSSSHDDSEKDLACSIRLSILLMHNAPEGAFRVVQGHTNKILNLFVNRSIFSVGPMKLRLQVLEFVSQLCSDLVSLDSVSRSVFQSLSAVAYITAHSRS
jgi:hypothetical protein